MNNWLSQCIDLAANDDIALPQVTGFTSERNRRLLNRLCSGLGKDECYLEVGVYHGATLVGALFGNDAFGIGIDNWCEYGTEREARRNVAAHLHDGQYELITGNCFDCLQLRSVPKIGVFFYDGSHTEDNTFRALIDYYPRCADRFALIVDDWNWEAVRVGTMRGLARLPLRSVEYHNLRTEGNGDKATWWNGLGAFWVEK